MNNIFKGIVVVFFMSILPLKSKAQINWNMPPNVHNERYIGDSYATKRPALTFNGFTGEDASKGYSLQKISSPRSQSLFGNAKPEALLQQLSRTEYSKKRFRLLDQ